MDNGFLIAIIFTAAMGFGFLAVGAKMADWNNPVGEALAGAFVFLVGCAFITMWVMGTIKLAFQTYGL